MQNLSINYTEDICPISEFRGDIPSKLEQTKSTHRPIILTQHGKSTAVFLDIKDFQEMKSRLEFLEEYRLAKQDIENGRIVNHDDAKKRILGMINEL